RTRDRRPARGASRGVGGTGARCLPDPAPELLPRARAAPRSLGARLACAVVPAVTTLRRDPRARTPRARSRYGRATRPHPPRSVPRPDAPSREDRPLLPLGRRGAARPRPPGHGLGPPILTYHKVDRMPPGARYLRNYVLPEQFAAQLAALASWGYRTVSFGDWLAYRRGAGSLPRRPIILSFDDGYRSTYEVAWP